ncbi:sorting nexin-8-like [Phymastichus coffea]|uniref:sorting nexin-8-like n=1 Tax=Phymastichus coffea TaxID=108790 RepID=UPI00273B2A93|nr:sorting nexin-8-like [Phymastichus coffea]
MASTDLSFGSIPPYYRIVYEKVCSPVSGNVEREVFKSLLVKSQLSSSLLSQIWDLVDSKMGYLTRSGLYKGLALVALAQQGKQPSDKLLENTESQELPIPTLGDLSDVTLLAQRLQSGFNPSKLNFTYTEICNLDTIEVNQVPEKKGIFLKHVEYQVTSKRFNSVVFRRYNDFVSLHELLLARFPYRLIPKLPPKKIVGADSQFLEERRRSLLRLLTLIARHPIIGQDPIVQFFFTYTGEETQHKIKEVFRRMPDEFATSELSSRAKELVPAETLTEFGSARDQIRVILQGVSRLKNIADCLAIRSHSYAADMAELGSQLNSLACESHNSSWATGGSTIWQDMKKGFHIIAKEFGLLSSRALQQAMREETMVCEQLNLLLDLLIAHRSLCERHERGVTADHQRALSTMLSLKKRQMQGVIRGTDADTVEHLENRMVAQESVIANMELRNQFSLHCLHMETQLVHAHLEILATVLQSLVNVQIRGHSELAEVWKSIEPTIMKCLPEKLASESNGFS